MRPYTSINRTSYVAILAATLTSCSGGNSVPASSPQSAVLGTGHVASSAEASLGREAGQANAAQLVYATGFAASGGVVSIYQATKQHKLVAQITTGITNFVQNCYVDRNGNLYVANGNGANNPNGNVVEYAPGATKPDFTYSTSLVEPQQIVAGQDGTLYVVDRTAGDVVEFPAKSNSPSLIIPRKVFKGEIPTAVTLDSKNALFVASSNFGSPTQNNVWRFDPKSKVGTPLDLNALDAPESLIFDKRGNLLVANGANGFINVYPPGQVNPTIQFETVRDVATTQIAFNEAETIFYAVGGDFQIYAYSYKTGRNLAKFGSCSPNNNMPCQGVAANPAAPL